jgi:hypothetical protein
MKKTLLIFIIIISSCSPQKQLDRLHKNHSYLFTKVKDTIHYIDTIQIQIPGTRTDTTFISTTRTDTIFLQKENFHTRLEIKGDTFYLSGGCDTIIKEVIREIKIPTEKYNVEVNKKPNVLFRTILFCFFLLSLFMLYVTIKVK